MSIVTDPNSDNSSHAHSEDRGDVEPAATTPPKSRERRNNDRITQILEAARDLTVDKGIRAVTVRAVAREVGISPGNVSYYFPSNDALLKELLEWIIRPYLEVFEAIAIEGEPEESLRRVMGYVLDDISTHTTTNFFPELWALSVHNPVAAQHMSALYQAYMGALKVQISAIRSDLNPGDVDEVALFICSSLEGQTVFIGHERPFAHSRSTLKKMALDAMMHLVKTYQPPSAPVISEKS